MPLIVFLPGAGLGSWIWDASRGRLPFPSIAVDLPSGPRGGFPEIAAREILEHLDIPAGEEVVLVLHSLAGVLEAPMVHLLGNRLAGVVHLASVVPPPGKSFASTRGFPVSWILRILFAFHPRGLRPGDEMILAQLGEGLPEALRRDLVSRHRPERPGLFLDSTPRDTVSPSRVYLRCRRDRAVPPALQTRIAARLGATVIDLETGHLPMLSDPDGFTTALNRAIRELGAISDTRPREKNTSVFHAAD